jgi:hypothetical protein
LAPRQGGAQLTLSRAVWDFETVEQGQSKAQKVVLTNSGDQPLTIEKIELPEGCSVAPDLKGKEIKPKENLEVDFTFAPRETQGKLQEYAYILLTDQTIIPLTIKGEVLAKAQPRLQVMPQTWDFTSTPAGDTKQQSFRCKNVGTADLKVEKVQLYDPRLQVVRNFAKETLAPGEEQDFVISVKTERPGSCETEFYIKSNNATGSFTKIPVKGFVERKPTGVVLSPDLSSVTNNTFYQVEVTRSDQAGKKETLTLERNATSSFPREPNAPPTRPTDYTLTIKMVTPAPPKPPEEKPAAVTPPTAPKPEAKPAEQKPAESVTPSPQGPSAKPEETKPSETPEKKEETKPEEGKEATPPAQKKEPEKPPEGQAPPSETSAQKPGEAAPKSEEQKKPEEPKEPSPAAPEKAEPEKPSGQTETKPGEKAPESAPEPPPAAPSKPPGS